MAGTSEPSEVGVRVRVRVRVRVGLRVRLRVWARVRVTGVRVRQIRVRLPRDPAPCAAPGAQKAAEARLEQMGISREVRQGS